MMLPERTRHHAPGTDVGGDRILSRPDRSVHPSFARVTDEIRRLQEGPGIRQCGLASLTDARALTFKQREESPERGGEPRCVVGDRKRLKARLSLASLPCCNAGRRLPKPFIARPLTPWATSP